MERGEGHEVPRTRTVTGNEHQGYQRGVEEVGEQIRERQADQEGSEGGASGMRGLC